ncbi:DUF3427 domain-containing protein [Geomonas terrae]|uniref:DUF3427 domain-containing protein n=1 Tax=Geomonas terrae TaxID=2562681 RepID=A0A4S1CDT0_9BACT|nr:DUF3427 domain-containing protein [Geomonas terrae]TGU71628.1 DUF3427 domain-containing protein [Geomonas terrae]
MIAKPEPSANSTLILYEDYDRKDVHDILAPDDSFTPQAGTWGLQGPIGLKDRPGDYAFFVTLGKVQHTGKVYDDGLTEQGVLAWDTQARQGFASPDVKKWIRHDSDRNSIYLFLRTSGDKKYTYLGRLHYITHDKDREKPVHFKWQILDWDIPELVVAKMGLTFTGSEFIEPHKPKVLNTLQMSSPPKPSSRTGVGTPTFKGKRDVDYSQKDAKNKRLGRLGELLVIEYEANTLRGIGRHDLADRIRHVAEIEGDGVGYDVESYDENGNKKFIEVKTTKGGISTAFFISANEVAFGELHPDRFFIYRIYEYNEECNFGQCFIVENPAVENLRLTPVNYRAEF